jgi:hypothetical protein
MTATNAEQLAFVGLLGIGRIGHAQSAPTNISLTEAKK